VTDGAHRVGLIGRAAGWGEAARDAGLAVVGRREDGAIAGDTIEAWSELFTRLEHPRRVLLDLAAGPEIDALLDEAYPFLEPGDVVIDLTPSWWCDTLRRWRRMRHRALYHVDAARLADGVLVVAGDPDGVALAAPVLQRLAGAGGRLLEAGNAAHAHAVAALARALALARAQLQDEAHQLLEALPGIGPVGPLLSALEAADQPADGRETWLLDDAVRLDAATPLLAQAVMLARAHALETHEPLLTAPRLGPFVHPDEID
jgi:6-phosphogluconate dehydrogenase (decarboxylating)